MGWGLGHRNDKCSAPTHTKDHGRSGGKDWAALTEYAKLQQLLLLKEMHLDQEATSLEVEMMEMMEVTKAAAEGEAGDSGKYEKAAATV